MCVSDVPIGMLVFLRCGCSGLRGKAVFQGAIPVAIQQPCATHRDRPVPRLEPLNRDDEVNPFYAVSVMRYGEAFREQQLANPRLQPTAAAVGSAAAAEAAR